MHCESSGVRREVIVILNSLVAAIVEVIGIYMVMPKTVKVDE